MRMVIAALMAMVYVWAGDAQAGERVKCATPKESFLRKAASQLEKKTLKKYPQAKKIEGWKFEKETGDYWASFAELEGGDVQAETSVVVYAKPNGQVEEVVEGVDEVYEIGCWSGKKK